MLKTMLTGFMLVSVLLFGNNSQNYAAPPTQYNSGPLTDTLQKMIVENGSVTFNLDLNGFNGSDALTTRPVVLQFAAATNSFFPILVLEKLPPDAAFDLAILDAKTGLTFFNVEGHEYIYDANTKLLSIQGGRL